MSNLGPTTIFGDLTINGSIGGAVRVAYVKTTPAAVSVVDVYLDTDTTGEEVQVTCSITDGTALNASSPLLTVGDMIFVAKINNIWYCMSLFHTT
jgi:hypothetical protein